MNVKGKKHLNRLVWVPFGKKKTEKPGYGKQKTTISLT